MIFSFTIDKPNDISATFKTLQTRAKKFKATLTGNEKAGNVSFNGVHGNYVLDEDVIRVNVLKKTLPIPNKLIEMEIRAIFRDASK